jgi:uncharacterized protein (TIGR03067 family)
MKWHVAVSLLATCCLLGAKSADEAARQDVEKWQGTWRAVSMETDGKIASQESLGKIKLAVTGTDYHFQNGTFSEHGSYKFDATKNPKQLDIVVGDGADKGKIYLVIYRVERDRLTLCLETANKNRPAEFTGKSGSGCVLEVWQRENP